MLQALRKSNQLNLSLPVANVPWPIFVHGTTSSTPNSIYIGLPVAFQGMLCKVYAMALC
jgi:hypothetical protein